jgi:hypothetical protein
MRLPLAVIRPKIYDYKTLLIQTHKITGKAVTV